jgi:hypothetical protein
LTLDKKRLSTRDLLASLSSTTVQTSEFEFERRPNPEPVALALPTRIPAGGKTKTFP